MGHYDSCRRTEEEEADLRREARREVDMDRLARNQMIARNRGPVSAEARALLERARDVIAHARYSESDTKSEQLVRDLEEFLNGS